MWAVRLPLRPRGASPTTFGRPELQQSKTSKTAPSTVYSWRKRAPSKRGWGGVLVVVVSGRLHAHGPGEGRGGGWEWGAVRGRGSKTHLSTSSPGHSSGIVQTVSPICVNDPSPAS